MSACAKCGVLIGETHCLSVVAAARSYTGPNLLYEQSWEINEAIFQ